MAINLNSMQVPIQDQAAKQRSDAARQLLWQQKVGATPLNPAQPASQVAQQAAPAMVQQAGQENVQQRAKSAQSLLESQQQQAEQQAQAEAHQIAMQTAQHQNQLQDQQAQLSRLGSDINQKLFQDRLQFEKDETGRKFTNARQLEDWSVSTAENQQQAANRLQQLQLTRQREIETLQTVHQKLVDAINRGWITKEQGLDQNQAVQLTQMANDLQAEIAHKQADASNKQMMYSGGGALAGGALGALAGPGGAAVGMSLGQGFGTMASGIF